MLSRFGSPLAFEDRRVAVGCPGQAAGRALGQRQPRRQVAAQQRAQDGHARAASRRKGSGRQVNSARSSS